MLAGVTILYLSRTVFIVQSCYACLELHNPAVDLRLKNAFIAIHCGNFTVYVQAVQTFGGQKLDDRANFFLGVYLRCSRCLVLVALFAYEYHWPWCYLTILLRDFFLFFWKFYSSFETSIWFTCEIIILCAEVWFSEENCDGFIIFLTFPSFRRKWAHLFYIQLSSSYCSDPGQ